MSWIQVLWISRTLYLGVWNLDPGSRFLGPESWILELGSWSLDPGTRILDGVRILDPRPWIQDPGSWRLDPGARVLDPGPWSWVQNSRIQYLGPRIRDPGSRTLDPGTWIQDSSILEPGSGILDPGHCSRTHVHEQCSRTPSEQGVHEPVNIAQVGPNPQAWQSAGQPIRMNWIALWLPVVEHIDANGKRSCA